MNYAPGEVRSCTGCHGQSEHAVPPADARTLHALTRAPSMPQPQPCDLVENGGDGLAGQVIHYPTDIQPIFDAKCVSCHGANEPAGGLRADRRGHASSTTRPTRNWPSGSWPVRSFPSSRRFSRATGATTTAPTCRRSSLGCADEHADRPC